MEDWLQSI